MITLHGGLQRPRLLSRSPFLSLSQLASWCGLTKVRFFPRGCLSVINTPQLFFFSFFLSFDEDRPTIATQQKRNFHRVIIKIQKPLSLLLLSGPPSRMYCTQCDSNRAWSSSSDSDEMYAHNTTEPVSVLYLGSLLSSPLIISW